MPSFYGPIGLIEQGRKMQEKASSNQKKLATAVHSRAQTIRQELEAHQEETGETYSLILGLKNPQLLILVEQRLTECVVLMEALASELGE